MEEEFPGEQQSPIDITPSAVVTNNALSRLEFMWMADNCVVLENNGKAPTFSVTPQTHYVQGGQLHGRYEMVQFHIHFSNTVGQGSEHSVNGKFYPAEVHFVHFKVSYGSVEEALKYPDGLAVVGAFIEIDEEGVNYAFEDDIRQLSKVNEVGSYVKCPVNINKYNLLGRRYYNYQGSLTTPGCYMECVSWHLLIDPIKVRAEVYQSLNGLKSYDGGLMASQGNSRKVQPLNGRKVFFRQMTTLQFPQQNQS